MNFQKYTQKGEAFVNEVARELGCPKDTDKAGRVLRSTLHVLRDQSTPEESMQLVAQLPMLIKAVFVDGWNIASKHNRVRQMNEFAMRVREVDGTSASEDFTSEEQTMDAIRAVFRVIKAHVSEGEIEDLRRTLPEHLMPLLE